MSVAVRSPLRLGIFENVNLLRGFAAVAVVVYHVIEHGDWTSFPVEGPLVTFRIGWIGVDLFFVISGFVITYSALVLYRNDAGSFRQNYWSRRITRIVPLYLLTLTIWIAATAHGFFGQPASRWAWQLLTHLTFTHSFFQRTHSAINGVNWTLAIEMQFYLAVALLIGWIDRTPGWRIWAYGIAIACAWRAAMFARYGHVETFLTFIRTQQFPGSLDEFGAGIFLAKLVIDGRQSRPSQTLAWLAGAAIIGYLTMSIYWRIGDYWNLAPMVVFWRVALSIFLLCVVGSAVRLPQTIATRWLRPLNYLGEISYGIYLWQLFAIQLFIHVLGLTRMPALLTVVPGTILLAAASWHWFERPIMALARR